MTYIMKPYDESLRNILENGARKKNRTGVDTLSIFGMQSRYDISKYFPILTKRKVWPKAIFAELLWFLSGSTNNKDLQRLGSEIWTPWVNKEFEQEKGYVEGSFGPIYGFQLRHFGGFYGNGGKNNFQQKWSKDGENTYYINVSYGEDGFDQLTKMVQTIKTDPDSRRNLFSLWNPKDVDQQILPCCHYTFQVSVTEGRLSGMLTQRSADMFLGVGANINFYSALIYMLAQQTGYVPGEFIHSIGDAHIYTNQIEGVEEYLNRKESPDSPTLSLSKAQDIYSYQMQDFVLNNYNPLKPIKVPVMV